MAVSKLYVDVNDRVQTVLVDTNVKAALNDHAAKIDSLEAGELGIVEVVYNVTHADFTETTNATAESITLGALPGAAVIVHAWMDLVTAFSGGTVDSCTCAVGTTDVDAYVEETSVFTGVSPGVITAARGAKLVEATYQPILADSVDLTATFLPGTDDLVALTAGEVNIHVLYRLLA